MRVAFAISFTLGVLALQPAPADAQSLRGLLGKAANRVADEALLPRSPRHPQGEHPAEGQPAREANRVAVHPAGTVAAPGVARGGPVPLPLNAQKHVLRTPHELEFAPELHAQKKRFLEFSRVSCSACEGGRSFDAWARLVLGMTGPRAWETRVGNLPVGEALSWRGQASDGVLKVVGNEQVAGFPCKQVEYRLTRREDGASMERPGLFCFGPPDRYVAVPAWVEVF